MHKIFVKISFFLFFCFGVNEAWTQAPVISYGNTNNLIVGEPATLAPVNKGGAVPATVYGSTSILYKGYYIHIATDAVGNLYHIDGDSYLKKVSPGGIETKLSNGVNYGDPIAADAKGDVYVVDGSTIYRIGVGEKHFVNYYTALSSLSGLAVDNTNNVYVTNKNKSSLTSDILKITAGKDVTKIASGNYGSMISLAVDNKGYIYISDTDNNLIQKISPTGKIIYSFNLIGSDLLSKPADLAVDADNNVFFTQQGSGAITKIRPINNSISDFAIPTIASGFDGPRGIALIKGGIYITEPFADDVKKLTLTGYTISKYMLPGLTFDGTTGKISGTPTLVNSSDDYTVTGYNTSGSSSVNISVKVGYNPGLSAIKINNGQLTPAFSPHRLSYTVAVDYTTSLFTVTPTPIYANSIVKVNGKAVIAGKASQGIKLAIGTNTIKTIVTTVDGNSRTYTLTVNRAKSSIHNPNLASLILSNVPFKPVFSGNTTQYTSSVPYTVTSTKIKYVGSDEGSKVIVNGKSYQSSSLAIPLNLGRNTINILVTASDGKTKKSYNVTINRLKAVQTVTFATVNKKYGDADFIPATVSSNLPLTFSISNTKEATLANGKIHILSADTSKFTITAHQAGNSKYASVTVRTSLNIGKAAQTIKFDNATTKKWGVEPFSPATASSGLPVSYSSSDLNIAYIKNGKISFSNLGSVSITAYQPGNNNYNAAEPKEFGYFVIRGDQIIKFVKTTAVYGEPDFIPATVSSGKLLTFTSSNPNVATVVGNRLHIFSAGKVIITANQQGDYYFNPAKAVSQEITVSKARQVITFTLPKLTYGNQDYPLYFLTNSGLPMTYNSSNKKVATIANGKIRIVGAGESKITVSQSGNANYMQAVDVSQTLVVNKAQLNVTADSKSKYEGHVAPVFSEHFNGFVNNDNAASAVQELPTLTTTATLNSKPGKYPITPSGGKSNNYYFNYVPGVLLVVAAPTTTAVSRNTYDELAAPAVHSSISPNGDGINDVLLIDNIGGYPDNKLTVMDKNGTSVYIVSGYNNATKAFDGHAANKALLKPGTYYYLLDYNAGSTQKRLTGYIIIKY